MADYEVKEDLRRSRTGHEVGTTRGIRGLQRTFHVKVKENPVYSQDNRPEFVLQSYRHVGKSAIPAGSPYPEQPGFVATTFRVLRPAINETNFWVRVGYEPDQTIASPVDVSDLWEKEFDIGLERVRVFFDLDGKPYGIPVYTAITEAEAVGPMQQNLFTAQFASGKVVHCLRPEGFISAHEQEGQGTSYQVSEAERKIPVEPYEWYRHRRVGTVRLSRDFAELDDDRRASAFNFVGLISDAPFLGAERGMLRFDGMRSSDPRVGYDVKLGRPAQSRQATKTEKITLTCLWNSDGWQPERFVHTAKDKKGNRAPIYSAGDDGPPIRQETQFRDWWYGDFRALLQLFD